MFGLVSAGTAITTGIAAAGAYSSYKGASEANDIAKANADAELQAYYDSPAYQIGQSTVGILNGKDAELDAAKYVADNNLADDEEFLNTYGGDANAHYDAIGKEAGLSAVFNPATTGLLDTFNTTVQQPMSAGLLTASNNADSWMGRSSNQTVQSMQDLINNQQTSNFSGLLTSKGAF